MRTTVTLDPETIALVKKAMRDRDSTFKHVVNEAIVTGLTLGQTRRITLTTHRLGPPMVDLDRALQLAGELEDAEIIRKMSMGK